MKHAYLPRAFRPAALEVIANAEHICDDYAAQGYSLTLRQLYYRFIATDAFPRDRRWRWTGAKWERDPSGTKNAEPNYKWLGELASDARLAGLIDWNHIEDRTRSLMSYSTWDSPGDIIDGARYSYKTGHWAGQPEYIEVWVEKEALAGVVGRPASRWQVCYFACKGYVSQSEMHSAALRLRAFEDEGRKTTVIHLGDHDPSGIDMTGDIQRRLELFGSTAEVDRIALNMGQITDDLPPSPAKITDSRAAAYIERFGNDSWELDAMEPAALDALVDGAIQDHLDRELYDEQVEAEDQDRTVLAAASANWDAVAEWLESQGMVEGG